MEEQMRLELSQLVRWIHGRGWAPGTGGNFSCVLTRDPLTLLMSPSGVDKGLIEPEDFLVVDEEGHKLKGQGQPSAETLLHTMIASTLGAAVIVHTHSIWNNLCSYEKGHNYILSGFEMLKGLSGVTSHEHDELVPIFDNSQDIAALSEDVKSVLEGPETYHAILLKGHGLYTWGASIMEAKRHLEVLEFLFELSGRLRRMD